MLRYVNGNREHTCLCSNSLICDVNLIEAAFTNSSKYYVIISGETFHMREVLNGTEPLIVAEAEQETIAIKMAFVERKVNLSCCFAFGRLIASLCVPRRLLNL